MDENVDVIPYYSIKCLLPHDRIVKIENKVVVPVVGSSTTVSSADNVFIDFKDENGLVNVTSLQKLGDLFQFEYTERLIFMHEADLRNSIYNAVGGPDTYEQSTSLELLRSIDMGTLHSDLSVRFIGKLDGVDVGYGLFSDLEMSKGSFIGEYVGLVSSISTSECASLSHHYNCMYPCCDGGYSINAREYGNIIRFINHSTKPNAEFRAAKVNDLMHVLCVACEDIYPGSQITVDYGAAFWVDKAVAPMTL